MSSVKMTEGQLAVLTLLSRRSGPLSAQSIDQALGTGASRSAASLVRHGWAVRTTRKVGRHQRTIVFWDITEAGIDAIRTNEEKS